jgi:hypothetical protein
MLSYLYLNRCSVSLQNAYACELRNGLLACAISGLHYPFLWWNFVTNSRVPCRAALEGLVSGRFFGLELVSALGNSIWLKKNTKRHLKWHVGIKRS